MDADEGEGGAKAMREGSRFTRLLHRFTATDDELEAEELRDQVTAAGAKPVDACSDRESVRVAGTIRSVTIRSRAGSPSLEAEVYDGSGTLTVVFLGRRRIVGIETGRSVAVYGRLTFHGSRPTMFNPRYEFLSAEAGVG
jgi:RecG-like helicase